MKRKDTWHADLADYIVKQRAEPFEWGKNDCALFAAGAVFAMTGEDVAKQYRGKYKSLRGAIGTLRKHGFNDHVEIVASILEEIHPSQAAVGDLAVVTGDDGFPALGIVQGPQIYLMRVDNAGMVDLLKAERAFRV